VGILAEPIAPIINFRVQLALARVLGVDDIWLGDHVAHIIPNSLWDPKVVPMARFVPDLDAFFDPTVLIARYARRRGPRMGTGVTDPFRRSPSDLARAWLSLHHATGGNVVLGIGAGERMNLDPINQPFAQPISRLEDTLSAIRAVWSSGGKPVTHEGKFHRWTEASFPPPYRGKTPPIWVAAEGPRACGVTGRYGDGWISITSDPKLWRIAWERVAAGAEDAGKDPEAIERSLLFYPLVGSEDEIDEACAAPLVKAAALVLPAPSWTSAGLSHPLGDDFAGPFGLDVSVFEGERWNELQQVLTPATMRKVLQTGPAEKVAEFLAEFVDNGLTHVQVANLGLMSGGSRGPRSMRRAVGEQRKLHGLLRKMRPGSA
jgi:phthiodiolone/phenolphthiodiolone dimycocerosates ketoreductase